MLNNLTIAFNNLRRNGIYSIVNIAGLAIGMAVATIILLWVYHQWSYDRFHAKSKNLYKVWCYDERYGNYDDLTMLVGQALLIEYPEIVNMTHYIENTTKIPAGNIFDDTYMLSDENLRTVVVAAVDTSFLSMFSFPLLQGDPATVLSDPNAVVITQQLAESLFGDKDPLDEAIFNITNIKITGVIADKPLNTKFGFDILMGNYMDNPTMVNSAQWFTKQNGNYTFVELMPGADVNEVSANIRDIVYRHTNGDYPIETYLQPLSKCHLYNKFDRGSSVGGRIETFRIIILIAVLILLIAAINFMNLSTAQSSKYAKEAGVRKVFGASRAKVVTRFLTESVCITAIAGVISLALVNPALSYFNSLVEINLSLNMGGGIFWICWVFFVLLIGILSGSYPAFYFSSYHPTKTLKGTFNAKNGMVTLRKILIVTQFVFAVGLIIFTIVMQSQLKHVQSRDLGFNKERLVSFQINSGNRHFRELIRRELLESGIAESVSNNFGNMIRSESKWETSNDPDFLKWRGMDPQNTIVFERNYAETDWAKTTGVQIIEGRDIDITTYSSDSTAMLLNETAVRIMGFDSPIGEIIYHWGIPHHVVGVVKDFVVDSPYDQILPMIIGGPARPRFYNNINIKLSAEGNLKDQIVQIKEIFKKYHHEQTNYWVTEEMYRYHFIKDQIFGSLVGWIAGLAVFISCLGLFGLSSYMAENRRKEMGIRKVMGASIANVLSLLNKEFLILIMIALLIALPVSWWAMTLWLSQYAYRTPLHGWIFAAVALITVSIALLTVSIQALRAATANPVKSIKTE